jgi:hypothetical protein
MTIVGDFGGIKFHNYFWAPYGTHLEFKKWKGQRKKV